MESMFMHGVAMFVLIAANLGLIAVITVIPAVTIWALYLKLSGKTNKPPKTLATLGSSPKRGL